MSEDDIKHLEGNNMTSVLKIDAPYFSVCVKDGVPSVIKTNGKMMCHTDMIIDRMYYDIYRFVKENVTPVIDKYEEGKHGFFYFPIARPRWIEYGEGVVGKFMEATPDHPVHIKGVFPYPVVSEHIITDADVNTMLDYRCGAIGAREAIVALTGFKKPAGEGVVFRVGGHRPFQIRLVENVTESNPDQKKMYRDTIVSDFARWYDETKPARPEGDEYARMESLFVSYMNSTDILDRYPMDEEDLRPPYTGYFGDMAYELIKNEACREICRHNPIYRGMFRVILKALTTGVKHTNIGTLTEADATLFNSVRRDILRKRG